VGSLTTLAPHSPLPTAVQHMQTTTYWESVRIGLESLRAHPTRTLLSTSGVVIGVLALVATLSITNGVDRWSRQLIERESSVQDIVLSTRRTLETDGLARRVHHAPVFTIDDWRSARAAVPHVSSAVLTVTGPTTVVGNGRRKLVLLTAGTANLAAFAGLDVQAGRFFTDVEVQRDAEVAVLGYRLATELAAPRDPLWLIGRTVRVGGTRREVIGVLAPRPGESDLVAFVPAGRRPSAADFDNDRLTPVLRLKATGVEHVPEARDATLDWIAQRFPEQRHAIEVTVGLERLERTGQAMLLTKLIFGLLVALMLAIGGIGIMNVLLASVAERTREIGIRKATGARQRDILLHFLAESVAIAAVGSLAGALLGAIVAIGSTAIFRELTGAGIWPIFTAGTLGWVMLAAAVVGVAFGTYPARLAARLTPVEAIQRE
jgi:putative ABC transport system permease protein